MFVNAAFSVETNDRKKIVKGITLDGREDIKIEEIEDIKIDERKEGFYFKDLHLSKGQEKELRNIFSRSFLHHPLNEELLARLKERIVRFYQNIGRLFVLVDVPPEQNITNGIIIVRIKESKLVKGITLDGSEDIKIGERKAGFHFKNSHLSKKQERELRKIFSRSFLHRTLNEELLTRLQRRIVRFYQNIDRLFILVDIPDQNLTDGIIIVRIKEKKIVKGITLDGSEDIKMEERKEGFHFKNLRLSKGQKRELRKIFSRSFLHRLLNEEILTNLKERIVRFYQNIGRLFVLVDIPDQNITDGIIIVKVRESKLDKIKIKGSGYFPEERYRKNIRLQSGDYISSDILGADIAWINRNPFRYAEIVCKSGEKECTTDIDVIVKEKRPVRVFAGTNNTGFKETGYQRAFAGINIGNLFGFDQLLSYQYTSDYRFKRFQSHVFSYEIPFPWRNVLILFGGISYVKATVLENRDFTTEGQSSQISGRYSIPFFYSPILHDIRFGVDFKRSNNNLIFGGVNISQQNVNIFQFVLEYRLSHEASWVKNDFSLEIIGSPGKLLPNMRKSRFNALRTGASPWYLYGRSSLKQLYNLGKKFTFALDLSGQLTSKKLLPSEQFGLGGYDTVRGYKERAVNADNAILVRLEPRSPPINLRSDDHFLIAYLFADFGVGWNQLKINENIPMSDTLFGVGPGIKYSYSDKIFGRLDWGYQVFKIENEKTGRNRFNFEVMISF